MDKQSEALLMAEVLKADGWPSVAAKLRQLHAENQGQAERIQDIYKQLNDTEKEVDDLRAELHEEAKINGAGAERELRLMAELDEAKRINLRDAAELRQLRESLMEQREAYNLYTTVSIEMRTKDEALLRRALTYLEYASQQLPMIHASIVDPVIDELKERLK